MNPKIKELLKSIKAKKVGLFIDNANWFYPQRELGWKISFSKLRKLFESYCDLVVLRIYAGTPLNDHDKKTFKRFSEAVRGAGFNLVTKPLKKIWIDKQKSKFQYKCNFDVEVALDIARQISKVDVVIIGSGDSDFLEIKRYALENKKRFITLCFEKGVSWEMRKGHHVFLEELREQIKRE